MATEAQIAANRRNAQKSTGPRTARGKRHVARNAITHGLDCRDVLHFDEDAAAFEDYRRKLIADTQPVGGEEQDWVEIMVANGWRLRRVFRVETQMHRHQRYRLGGDSYNTGACVLNDLQEEKGFPYVDRKEANLIRQYKLASRELRDLQRLRREGVRHVVDEAAEDVAAEAPVEPAELTPIATKAEPVAATPEADEVKTAEQSQIATSDQGADREQSQSEAETRLSTVQREPHPLDIGVIRIPPRATKG
ncbi:MAG TPA: hypothetical protein VF678_12420 [bacterium]